MNRKPAFSQLSLPMGLQNVSTVAKAKGTAAARMKGMRRPALDLHRSDRDAIQGSVTASKMRPNQVMAPKIVRIPKITKPWGMKIGWPAAWVARSG